MPSELPSITPLPRGQRAVEWFRDWKAGDARAGDALFRELGVRLRAYFRRCPSHVLEDLVQETLVACVVAREALRCDEALMSYVYAVARRVLMHHLHDPRRCVVVFDEDRDGEDAASPPPEHLVEVARMLRAHPTPFTRLVVLRYVEGHQGVELARQLGISEASVRRRLCRGLDELRRSRRAPTSS